MVVITVQAYKNAGIDIVIVKSKELFWVKTSDVQNGLGLKNVLDLVRKEICGIFETKNLTKEQKRKYIKTKSKISEIPTDGSKFKYAVMLWKK